MDDLFDDPIADLLSEGSNDSFFEDPKVKPKNTKSVANVFNLTDDKLTDIDKQPIKVDEKPVPNKDMDLLKTAKPRERKTSFDGGDPTDLLETETKKSKVSIMNEILGISSKDEPKVSSFDDILKSSNVKKEPIQKTEDIEKILSEPRRSRRTSANLDPLGLLDIGTKSPEPKRKTDILAENVDIKTTKSAGLLGTNEKPTDSLTKISKSVTFLESNEPILSGLASRRRESPKKQRIESGLPDWLQESSSSAHSKSIEVTQKPAAANIRENVDKSRKIETDTVTTEPKKEEVAENVNIPERMTGGVFDTILKQQTSNLEIQNSSLALQQQEGQLLMALQLKKYEQNLVDMQKTQQDILTKQEKQFNILIEKQFAKQQMMEETMRLQQERINQHIQLLLSQPVLSNLKDSFEEHQRKEDILKDTFEENRNFYNDIIISLKQKHEEEITLLVDSYKKQLEFLEMSLESTESRLKTEIESLNSYYVKKLQDMTAKNEEIIVEYEAKIKKINENNDILLQEVKNNYNELIKEIKIEYKRMIEDINDTKNKEQEIMSNTGIFTEKLNESLDILKDNTMQVSQIQSTIINEKHLLNDIKAGSLSAKEQEIKMMQESIEKQRIASDNERAQLLALIKTLEVRLVEQTQAAREERWTLQQATATMTARALAMDKEIEYLKRNLDCEREQLKSLKEAQLAEHEKIMLDLTEQKLSIAAEKSRLETSAKLSQNYDQNKSRAEIEAALQVAKEATELTDREREKLYRQQIEIETIKRQLLDKERKFEIREQEIENLTKIADQKYKDGEKALLEARAIENKCSDRMKDIQRHSVSLTNREKKLAEEKISLSKERLSIHNTMKENKCGLCKVDVYANENDDNVVEQDHSESYKIQDLELMRLKFELEDTIPTSIRDND